MLKVMRDSFHHLKWILIAVVAAFVFGFVFIDMGLGGGGIGGSTGDQAFAARVNGETISYNDFYRSMKRLEDMYKQAYGQQFTPEMAAQMGLSKQVLDNLIEQRLLTQEARRLNIEASPEEVRRKLLELPQFADNGKFIGMELYTRYVTGPLGYASTADFENELAREIALQKMESALQSSIVVSPKAVETEYRRANENAKIRYVLLPAATQLAGVSVTPKEVETYYSSNQAKYTHGEQRSIRYLMADYAKIRATIKPTDEELRKRYDANKDAYRQPASAHVLHILVKVDPAATPEVDAAARAKAQGLVQQLRGGADFAGLARANSDDPSSSGNGGDMGFVTMGQTVEPFEQAIFSIPLNTVSDPIRTKDFGYHIVKVVERRSESVRSFEEMKPTLAAQATNDMARDVAKAEINRINAGFKANKPANADAFSAQANDKITSSNSSWFGKNDPIGTIGQHAPLSQWAFSAKPGDVSDPPIGTPKGIIIAYMEATRPAGVAALSEIREKVEQDAKMAKAREAAKTALAQMMAGATSIDAIAAKAGQAAQDASVGRQGSIAGLNGDVSSLVDTTMAANVNDLKGPVIVGDGAVAFQVIEQKKVTPQELEQNRATYADQLRAQQARSLRATLLERLRKAAKVEVNDEITRPTTTPAGV
ncbi:MAG TPA: peptidyl-prolyl cis-trans isomerase [Thermoanaerobaculia bacterium]|nr:peptidyl-prolyl cis-trans isomerase [Thermoanaerobaculia bacterium]